MQAQIIRAFLKDPIFNTNAKRMGIVARVRVGGVEWWQKGRPGRQFMAWANP